MLGRIGACVAVVVCAALAGCEEAPPEDGASEALVGGRPDAGRGVGEAPDGAAETPDGAAETPDGAAPAPDGGTPDAAVGGAPPEECATFADDVAPILQTSCAGCHGASGGLTLTGAGAYDALVGVPSTQRPDRLRVAPGDPDRSYLLEKLRPGPSVGGRMPLGGSLAEAQIATVRDWIAAGAPRTADECAAEPPPPPPPSDVGAIVVEAPPSIAVGRTLAATAVVRDPDGEVVDAPVAWRVEGEDFLYVDGAGTLLGVMPGRARVIARADDVESAPVTVEVVEGAVAGASFRGEVLPMLRARCATAGCHVDDVEPGDLRFDRGDSRMHEELTEEEAETFRSMRRVTAYRPDESFLFVKIAHAEPPAGARMPLGAGAVPADEVNVVLRWILAGAPND